MSSSPPGFPPSAASDAIPDSEILRMLMDAIPDRIYFKDLQSRFVRNNTAHATSLGAASPSACLGRTDFDFFAHDHAARALADEQEIIRTGRPLIGKIERTTLRGSDKAAWVSTTKLPWFDETGRLIGTFGLTRDVTAAHAAEEKLTEERNLLRTIIDHLPSRIFVKDTQSRFLLSNLSQLHWLGVKSEDGIRGKTTLDFFPTERGHQAMADDQQVLRGGPPILSQEKNDPGAGDTSCSLTTKVPLRDVHGTITGLVGISHDITARKRTEQELQRRTGEMETDLRMARQIQEAFFPRVFPVFPRGVPAEASALRFAYRYLPAATLGGDFFDIIQLSDTQCGLLICDVMGHGVRAGLLTALIRGAVEEFAPHTAHPALVLAEINRGLMPIVHQTGQPVFATAFYGIIDTATGTLSYANAGHPPPLIQRGSSGSVESLAIPSPEPAAGLMEDFVYSSQTTAFRPGDTLLAYTDGFFEASNADGAMFGEARLRALLGRKSGRSGAELIEHLIREVVAFTGRSDFEDDLCALAVESTGNSCAVRPTVAGGI